GVAQPVAAQLVRLAEMTRNLKDQGLEEGASTRLLIHVGRLITSGITPRRACEVGIAETLTDDHEMLAAVNEMVSSLF
ncbi:MAG TPA: CbbQ/NirQ/NorQ C-terminal domain-containing protein, partial [bacterium]